MFHLTHAGHALSAVALQRLKIARINELNDPFDLLAANLGGNKALKSQMREWRSELHKTTGLLCFSSNWYSPLSWSHYADKHRGICLGFALADAHAAHVTYVSERVPIPSGSFGILNMNEPFIKRLLLTKYEGWAYEQEVRVFVQLDPAAQEHGLYFFDFSESLKLQEVILGALCELSLEKVRRLVVMTEPTAHVFRARLADKFFNVVPDEDTLEKDYVNPLDGSRRHPRTGPR